jgi:integron integrase
VEQARKAIGLLYRQYLRIDPRTMPATRSRAARDRVRQPRQIEALHGPLLKAAREALRMKRYSPRTEAAYLGWIRRFVSFHDMAPPDDLHASHIRDFLSYLATERGVASSTQNQALNAIVFLYSRVLGRDPGDFSDFLRAKMPKRTPAALSKQQVEALLEALEMPYRLMALLMYGSGLRVTECLQLRVQDLGFDTQTIHVHGKGAKDRTAVLPPPAERELRVHLESVRAVFEEDRVHDSGLRWAEQYVFPSRELRVDPRTRKTSRGHVNRNSVQNALAAAAAKAEIPCNVTPHTLRHAFAEHMVAQGAHIQTIQELLGHARLSTTMIYTHPMNRPGKRPGSPLRALPNTP